MSNQPRSRERRSVPRNDGLSFGPVEVNAAVLGGSVLADVQDISIKGIALLVPQSLEPGMSLTIQRRTPSRRLSPALAAEVRRVAGLPDGTQVVGCAFSRLLTIEDLS